MPEPASQCRYCGGEMRVSQMSYRENPFCFACHDERVAQEAEKLGTGTVELVGDYFVFVPVLTGRGDRTPSSSGDLPGDG